MRINLLAISNFPGAEASRTWRSRFNGWLAAGYLTQCVGGWACGASSCVCDTARDRQMVNWQLAGVPEANLSSTPTLRYAAQSAIETLVMTLLECPHAVSLHCAHEPRQRTCILSEVIIDPSAWAGWLYAQRFGTCLSRAAISGWSTIVLL